MYLKLALKNMKQSTKDYLIYMITLVLSVAMFYGFFSIVSPYYSNMLPISIHMEILNKAMRIAVPAVGILILFLVSYVNRYMLKRKQKEFALQTIIGMEQRTVAWIFFLENLMIGALALILGILSGTILSQLINAAVLKAFKQEFKLYFILDEPINGLDPIGIAEVRSFIRELCDSYGKTIIISSHILSEISLLADDIGIIDRGVLLEEESLKELEEKNAKYIHFITSNAKKAAQVIESLFQTKNVKITDEYNLYLYDTVLPVAKINRTLIESGIDIKELHLCEETLEDYFKKITGGEGIA